MTLVIGNALLYLITLLVYWHKQRRMDYGFVTIAFYLIVAICCIFEYIAEPHRWELTAWPFVYLFIANLILFLPLFPAVTKSPQRCITTGQSTYRGCKYSAVFTSSSPS